MPSLSIAASLLAQAITFGQAPTIPVGVTGVVAATASSGLAVTYSSLTPSTCRVNNQAVTGLAAGTCTVAANQAGDATYDAAPQVAQDISITANASSVADVSSSPVPDAGTVAVGRDVRYTIYVRNFGAGTANAVVLDDAIPAGTSFVWASPSCALSGGVLTCPLGSIPSLTNAVVQLVVRPDAAGSFVNTVTLTSSTAESDYDNNASTNSVTVIASPPASAVTLYRLYSPVTLEHLYTTDLNEYNTLGAEMGTWTQEGTVGHLLDNAGSFNGVTAVPYYRLYDTATQRHHWTTDPNEYYTLIQFPNWNAEGIDGFILPTSTTGATQLYRLMYPFVPGLHHWTIDPNEYNTLITSYGWIGEGGSGFVIQ